MPALDVGKVALIPSEILGSGGEVANGSKGVKAGFEVLDRLCRCRFCLSAGLGHGVFVLARAFDGQEEVGFGEGVANGSSGVLDDFFSVRALDTAFLYSRVPLMARRRSASARESPMVPVVSWMTSFPPAVTVTCAVGWSPASERQ